MFIDPEMDWQAGLGWGRFSTPDEPWSIWRDPDWRPWAEDFMSMLPWEGTGVVDVDAEALAEACERYCLAVFTEAIPIGRIGRWLWAAKGPLTKLFIKGAPHAVRAYGPRVLSRQAKITLTKRFEGLVKKGDEVRPLVMGTAGAGAQVLRATQYVALGDALNERFRVDSADFAKRLVERLQRRAGQRPDFDDFINLDREEDDMPYNRRTGQWYPARRRGGYSKNYRRGGSSRRGGYGYGNYRSRRRTYRRW